MKFLPYEPTKREEWDQFVLSNPQGALGHLSSQFLLAEDNSGTTNRSILMYQDSMQLVGILPLYEVRYLAIRMLTIRTLASTTGPLFRPTLAAAEQRQLLDALIDYVKSLANECGVDRVSITYPSIIEEQLAIERFGILPLRRYGFTENNMLGTYLDLRRNEADLLVSLEKTCRYKIRKAEKDGVSISPIKSREDWLGCETLNEQTLGEHKHSKRMMEIVWDEFIAKGYAHAFIAKHEDRVLSVEVIQTFRQCAYAWIAYNARPILIAGANNYLLWHSILHAKQLGASFFLMGTHEFSDDAKMQGISDFKKSFGGVPYYVLGGTLVRRKIKHHFILLFSEAARLARAKVRGWKLTLKKNRRSTTVKHTESNRRTSTSLSKAG
jgi:hypothetical protein